jgi:hypothetical protein
MPTWTKHTNFGRTTLSADIATEIATTATLTSLMDFPVAFPFWLTLWDAATYPDPINDVAGREVVQVTANPSALTYTIVRAQCGTSAHTHAAGAAAALCVMAEDLQELQDAIDAGGGGGAPHAVLSATHTDALVDTVIRGDIVYGNATPKWARLPFPGTPTGKVLVATATDVAWSAAPLGTAAFTPATNYAVAAKGVTNGDSHDHNGGDGAVIPLAGMASMATASLLGRKTAGSGAPEVLSATDAKTVLSLAKGDVGLGSVDNVQQLPASYLDTDGTLAANSDAKVASQKAVVTYVAARIATNAFMTYKGATDCSGNPNYPAAIVGDAYVVSVAGKIGGASGVAVTAGDLFLCTVANAGGTQAVVGTSWDVIQVAISGMVIGPASSADGKVVLWDGTSGKLVKSSSYDPAAWLTSVTAHNLLSATHGDTLADTVVRGDVMVGNNTPKWNRLAFPATPTGKVLVATATDVAWSAAPLGSAAWANTGDFAAVGQTMYLGTTAVAINRASGALSLAGVNIDGAAGSASVAAVAAVSVTVSTAVHDVDSGPYWIPLLTAQSGNVSVYNATALYYDPNAGRLTAPIFRGTLAITGGSAVGLTGLAIRDTSAAFDVYLAATSSVALTAARALTIDLVNASRTLKLGANFTISNSLTLAGTDASTLNIGTGGTLGSAAYTPLTDYAVDTIFQAHQHATGALTKVFTSQDDWDTGTKSQVDTATTPGSVLISTHNILGYNQTGGTTSKLSTSYNVKLKIYKATGLTLEGWIYQTAQNCNNGIITNGPLGSTQGFYQMCLGGGLTTSRIYFILNQDANEAAGHGQLTSVAAIPNNQLTHWRCTWDGSTMKIFINGVLDNSKAYTTNINYTANDGLTIGNYYNGSKGFVGDQYEIRVSNTVRDGGTNFTPTMGYVTDANTVALYQFTNQTATTVSDASGNGIDATMSGSCSWLNKAIYYSSGTDIIDFDASVSSAFDSIGWNATTPAGTLVKCRFSSAATQAALTNPAGAYITTPGTITISANRWIRCEYYLATTDVYATPSLADATLTYTPASGQGGTILKANVSGLEDTASPTFVAMTLTGALDVTKNSIVPITGRRDITDATISVNNPQLALRNADTTTGNYVQITFQSNDSAGTARNAASIKAVFAARASGTIAADLLLLCNNASAVTQTEIARACATGSFLIGTTTDGMTAAGSLAIAKDLAHRGTNVGFFNIAPAARPGAYTQTYSTASRTVSNPTAATLTDNTGGTADTTLASVEATYTQATIRNNFADLANMVNKLTADNLVMLKVITQLIDDGQILGYLQ